MGNVDTAAFIYAVNYEGNVCIVIGNGNNIHVLLPRSVCPQPSKVCIIIHTAVCKTIVRELTITGVRFELGHKVTLVVNMTFELGHKVTLVVNMTSTLTFRVI